MQWQPQYQVIDTLIIMHLSAPLVNGGCMCPRGRALPPTTQRTRRRAWHTQGLQQRQNEAYQPGCLNIRPVSSCAAVQQPATEFFVQNDFQADKRPVILFDGVCNMCNGFVNLMLDLDPQGRFRMAALQSPAGMRLLERCGRNRSDISSIVLVDESAHYIKSDAVLEIAKGLENGLPLLAYAGRPVPPVLRDFLYDVVATNRYVFLGKREACRVSEAGFETRFLVE